MTSYSVLFFISLLILMVSVTNAAAISSHKQTAQTQTSVRTTSSKKRRASISSSTRHVKFCEGISEVNCFMDKWRPNALRFGICPRAIECVRFRMIRKVHRYCLDEVELANYLGASMPVCVHAFCSNLKNGKFAPKRPPTDQPLVMAQPPVDEEPDLTHNAARQTRKK